MNFAYGDNVAYTIKNITYPVDLSQVLSKNRVERLSVSTGCGIKPHQRLKLFNERRDVRPSAWPLEGVDEGAAVSENYFIPYSYKIIPQMTLCNKYPG